MTTKQLSHHSSTDWDFSTTGWILDTTDFVSPPSSFALPSPGPTAVGLSCKHPNCLVLPEGRIASYFKFPTGGGYIQHEFRNVGPPDTYPYLFLYRTTINPPTPTWLLQEIDHGGVLRSWSAPLNPIALDEWIALRLTWWLTWGILLVRLEKLVASSWQKQGNDICVQNPLFGTEIYQRPGFRLWRVGLMNPIRADDTEIYSIP